MGWFDGNPAHLWQHPPQAQGTRHVRALGGADKAVETAQEFTDEGDLRFAAELASHVVFAHPDHPPAMYARRGVNVCPDEVNHV